MTPQKMVFMMDDYKRQIRELETLLRQANENTSKSMETTTTALQLLCRQCEKECK